MRIRDRKLSNMSIPKISIAVEPLDKISQRFITVKHHGALMSAERGLNLRLPKIKATETVKRAYKEVVAEWINAAFRLVDGNGLSPPIEVKLMQYGRIEAIPSRKRQKGIVIGAPHGTFDEYTAEMVMQISQQTGLAAVIGKGFTPTECAGWRINVNRPTERRYPAGEIEIDSKRAKETYQNFKQAVLNLAHGSLDLYIDIHQNGQQNNIEVATVGVTKDQAQFIKNIYRKIRDQMLQNAPGVEAVELAIEPLDAIEIGAWGAKAEGILGVAKQSLHIELPAHRILGTANAREAYQNVLAVLLDQSVGVPSVTSSTIDGRSRRSD